MKLKSFIIAGSLLAIAAFLPMASAFEAHVLSVTGEIVNALGVPVSSLDFGTVFPQERLDKQFGVALSDSFVADPLNDDVEYVIRQKPKCWNGNELEPEFSQVTEDEAGNFTCLNPEHTILPLLCPYLSKHELTTDGTEQENDGADVAAFHGPITLADWTLAIAEQYEVPGRLVKSASDTTDAWNIDLKVPCFTNQCAQDWEDFVHEINPQANPADYVQSGANEHALFGCDLWLEVTSISTIPASSTIVVTKIVVNDSGTGTSTVADFPLFANAIPVTSSVPLHVPAGVYTVSEITNWNYTAAFSGDCNASGTLSLASGEIKGCTITNTDKSRVSLLADTFGTGNILNDIPNWEEEGNDADATTIAMTPVAFDPASPNGGRFARIAMGEWMCSGAVNANVYHSMLLRYFYKGDTDAEAGDTGVVEYYTGGTCDAPTGLAALTTHALTSTAWSAFQTLQLPGSLDSSTFFLRFRSTANQSNEHFRVDNVVVTGIPNN